MASLMSRKNRRRPTRLGLCGPVAAEASPSHRTAGMWIARAYRIPIPRRMIGAFLGPFFASSIRRDPKRRTVPSILPTQPNHIPFDTRLGPRLAF